MGRKQVIIVIIYDERERYGPILVIFGPVQIKIFKILLSNFIEIY